MPLPDAIKKSPRVYTLLQNLDLENLSGDDLASVADPIAIEEANEDELRRLCLVAFARMVTKGSFDGWLTSGGGDPFIWQNSVEYNAASGYGGTFWNIATQAPLCRDPSTATIFHTQEEQFWNPFVAPFTGAPSACNINVALDATSSQNLYVGFYSGTNGLPATMLGYATMSTDSTGIQRVTSFTEASTGSLTFTAGQMYYYSINKSGTENTTLSTCPTGAVGQVFADQAATVNNNMVQGIMSDTTITSAPADVAADDLWNGGTGWKERIWVWLEK